MAPSLSRTLFSLLLLPSLALAQAGAGEPAPAADACGRTLSAALPDGPVTVAGFHEADFAQARRACPRSEVGLGARGGAIIDTPAYYGALDAEAVLFGSARLTPTLELFGTAELLRFQYGVNATLSGTAATLGQVSAGAALLAVHSEGLSLSPTLRVLLPTSLVATNGRTAGVELGAAGSLRLSERLALHGWLGGDVTAGLSSAPYPRAGLVLNAGVQYALVPWLAVVLDANVQAFHRAGLDLVAPAVALRVAPFRGLGAELGATLPLAGADRHDAIFGLRLGYRL